MSHDNSMTSTFLEYRGALDCFEIQKKAMILENKRGISMIRVRKVVSYRN